MVPASISWFSVLTDILTLLQPRGVIYGKAGKAAALPKFSDTLTLSQLWADYAQPAPAGIRLLSPDKLVLIKF